MSLLSIAFLYPLSSITIPKIVNEALDHPEWRPTMITKMQPLDQNSTWKLVPLLPGKKTIGCRWVYAIKIGPNGEVVCLNARLVAK